MPVSHNAVLISLNDSFCESLLHAFGEEGQRVYEPAAEIERAMMGYEAVSASIGGREPGTKATATHLRARASAV